MLGVLKSFSPLEKEHVGRLERVLKEKQFTRGRLYAAEELARLGEDARPAAKSLLAAVADDDVAVRRKSLEALAPVIDAVAATAFKPLVARVARQRRDGASAGGKDAAEVGYAGG